MVKRIDYKNYDSIRQGFIENAILQGEYTISGDYKNGNRAADKLYRIKKLVLGDKELCKKLVDDLLLNDNDSICCWVSIISLVSGYRCDEAVRRLEKVRKCNKTLIGFNAEMTLKLYHNGELE